MKGYFRIFIFTSFISILLLLVRGGEAANHKGYGIVFSSFREASWNLWSIDEKGQNLKKLSDTQDDEHCPAISPDGEMLAYHTNRREIWIMFKNNGKLQPRKVVALENVCKPKWFPGGEKIAFVNYTFTEGIEHGDIFATEIPEPIKGERLSSPKKLIKDDGIINTFSISPDGKTNVYSLLKRAGSVPVEEIWLRKINGGLPKRLTHMEAICSEPAWSPDGSQIAFSSNNSGNYDIWLINEEGTSLRQLTQHRASDSNPAWSPDGKKIVFQSTRSGKINLWILNLKTGKLKQLTKEGEDNQEPAW